MLIKVDDQLAVNSEFTDDFAVIKQYGQKQFPKQMHTAELDKYNKRLVSSPLDNWQVALAYLTINWQVLERILTWKNHFGKQPNLWLTHNMTLLMEFMAQKGRRWLNDYPNNVCYHFCLWIPRYRDKNYPTNVYPLPANVSERRNEYLNRYGSLSEAREFTESEMCSLRSRSLLKMPVASIFEKRAQRRCETSRMQQTAQPVSPNVLIQAADCRQKSAMTPDDWLIDQQVLEEMLAVLPSREQIIIKLHYGFETGKPISLADIGRILGISRERVRQLKEQALRHLTYLAKQEDFF